MTLIKALTAGIILLLVTTSVTATCVFCNKVEDKNTDHLYFDADGWAYRAPIAPDNQSEYGYFEDGTKIPCNVCTTQPSAVLEKMEEYSQKLREAGKKAFPRAATVYDVIIPEREDGETTLPL